MSFFSSLFGKARAAEQTLISDVATDVLKVSARLSSVESQAKAQASALIDHAKALEARIEALEARFLGKL